MQEEFSEKAGSDLLARKLARTRHLFSNLQDEDAGFHGAHVLTRLEKNGLTFSGTGENQKGFASYRPFDPTERQSYINLITCPVLDTNGEERADADFYGSAFHELIHADSWDRVPELHASPFNANAPVILCPEDFALMTVITERVAYANMGWLLSLAHKDAAEIGHVVTPVNAMMFEFLRAREGDLGRALSLAADVSMRETLGSRCGGAKITMEEYYYDCALNDYKKQVEVLAKKNVMPLVVRLEAHNFLSIAESFGPNIMTHGQSLTPIPAVGQAHIRDIHDMLDRRHSVPSYQYLPTFDEGLARRGYTPAGFLEMSKTAGTTVMAEESVPTSARKQTVGGFFTHLVPSAGPGALVHA